MKTSPTGGIEVQEKPNNYGLFFAEVKDGLSGLQNNKFPLYLHTKRRKSDMENGGVDFDRIANNPKYKESKNDERKTLTTLLDSSTFKTALQSVKSALDIACGNGETTNIIKNQLPNKVDLLDVSDYFVGRAQQTIGIDTIRHTHIKDYFKLNSKEKSDLNIDPQRLNLFFGFSFGNLSVEEKIKLRHTALDGGEYTILTYRHHQSLEEGQQAVINMFDTDEVKQQSFNMLRALKWTQQDINNVDFKVQFKESSTNSSGQTIQIGIVPRKKVVIYQGQDYTFNKGNFYELAQSELLNDKDIQNLIESDDRSSGGDRIIAKDVGEYTTAILIEHNHEKKRKEQIIRKTENMFKWVEYITFGLAMLLIGKMYIEHQGTIKEQRKETIQSIITTLEVNTDTLNKETEQIFHTMLLLNSLSPTRANNSKFHNRYESSGEGSIKQFLVNNNFHKSSYTISDLLVKYLSENQIELIEQLGGNEFYSASQIFDNPVLDYLKKGSTFYDAINNSIESLHNVNPKDLYPYNDTSNQKPYYYIFFDESLKPKKFQILINHEGKKYAIWETGDIEESQRLSLFTKNILTKLKKEAPYTTIGGLPDRRSEEGYNQCVEESFHESY